MRITLSTDSIAKVKTDLLAVGVRSAKLNRDEHLKSLDEALGGGLAALIADEGFEAKAGQTLKFPTQGKIPAKWVVVVGVEAEAPKAARTLGHAAAKAASRQKSAALFLPGADAEVTRGAARGIIEGVYRYELYKTQKAKGGLGRAVFLVDNARSTALRNGIAAGTAIAEGVNLARDLVNGPPNELNPITLAKTAQAEAKKLGVKCTVWNKKKIADAGMNLFLAVNAGSAIEPRMIHVAYEPKGAKKKVAFVGKGLTFDAGGLCIKPGKSMVDMKCDMAGSATTLGIVLAAAKLKLPIAVHAVIGSTENMTGAEAYRPGDVFTAYDGKTVEIINTDAEGRLVLADVLAWTAETIKPEIMIDHATLTGACMVALGNHRAGLFTDDDELSSAYTEAAGSADERFWQLPLDKDMRSGLDSFVADLKHMGGPYGGSITAALFLKEFVGKTRWMHLDIAGPAFNDGPHGRAPKGGTGFGVATGVRFLEGLAGKK